MNKKEWKEKIEQACNDAGTYQDYFDSVIDSLAQIMEYRDITHKKWVEEGCEPIIIHTNKAGEPNPTKNPLLTLLNDLHTQSLAYWRDLGLSPSGLKKLKADIVVSNDSTFEDLLNKLDNG